MGIEKIFFEKKSDFIIYLLSLFKKIKQKDYTGWGGSITNDDYDAATKFIYEHYSYFRDYVLNLSKSENFNTIKIKTNRISDFIQGIDDYGFTLIKL